MMVKFNVVVVSCFSLVALGSFCALAALTPPGSPPNEVTDLTEAASNQEADLSAGEPLINVPVRLVQEAPSSPQQQFPVFYHQGEPSGSSSATGFWGVGHPEASSSSQLPPLDPLESLEPLVAPMAPRRFRQQRIMRHDNPRPISMPQMPPMPPMARNRSAIRINEPNGNSAPTVPQMNDSDDEDQDIHQVPGDESTMAQSPGRSYSDPELDRPPADDAQSAEGRIPETYEEFVEFVRPHLDEDKDKVLRCLKIAYGGLDELLATLERTTFEMKNNEISITLNYCARVYRYIFTRGIENLGVIGESIKVWMRILNQFLIDTNGDGFRLLQEIQNIQQLPVLERPLRDSFRQSDLHQPSSSSGSEPPSHDLGKEYLRRAFIAGDGICFHVTQTPYNHFGEALEQIWSKSEQLSLAPRTEPKLPHFDFIDNLKRPRPEGFYSVTSLYIALRRLCIKLQQNPSDNFITSTGIYNGDPNNIDELKAYVESSFHWLLEQTGFQKCTWEQIFRARDINVQVRRLTKTDRRRLLPEIDAATSKMFERCLQPVVAGVYRDRIELLTLVLEDRLSSHSFTKELDTFVQNSALPSHISILDILNSRDLNDHTELDELFTDPRQRIPTMSVKIALAYLNGSGLCNFYNSLSVFNEGNLFNLVELMDQFASIKGFRIVVVSDITSFYYMWKHCQIARLVRFGTTYPEVEDYSDEILFHL